MVSQQRGLHAGPASRSRLSAGLGWAVTALFLVWAVFASLAVAHLNQRLEGFRGELQDEREDAKALRREANEARAAVEDRLLEYDALRGRAGELLNLLCRNAKAPEDIRLVLDALKRLGLPVYGTPLGEEDLARALQRLKTLASATSGGPVQSVEWVKGMRILARHGLLAEARVPEAVDLVGRELYVEATATVPASPASPAPAGTPAPSPAPTVAGEAGPPPPLAYRSAEARFSVQFPHDWTVKDKDLANAVLAQSPRLNAGLIDRGYAALSGVRIQQDLLEEEYARQRLDTLKADNPGFRVEKEGPIPLDGAPAIFTLGVHPSGAQEMKTLSVVAVRGGIGYWLTFRARADLFPRLEPAFLEILASFRVTP